MGTKKTHHRDRLIVFGRYPVPGQTKTRLIPVLGPAGAAELQRQLTEKTFKTAQAFASKYNVELQVCYDGGSDKQMRGWLRSGALFSMQRTGDLGVRMDAALHEAFRDGCGRVVLIGTDVPEVKALHLEEAFDALKERDVVLGPSTDGGYWLVGLKGPAPIFDNTPWGTEEVLAKTLWASRERGVSTFCLDPLKDIDSGEDLEKALPGWARPYLSIVIPALNEAGTIEATIHHARSEDAEIIVSCGRGFKNKEDIKLISELADVLEDLSQPYYVLFKGDHTLFIASEHKWPNGEMLLENVHRLALLKEGADPKYGAVIRIRGEQFFVKREKDHREEKKLWDAVFDANIDATPLRSYTAVIDITPEEFQEKYAKDFLAHVFLHRPHLNANEIMGELDTIDEILENHKISELALGVGWAGKTLFSTFELDGKLAFQLKYTRSGAFNTTNVLFVAKTVIEYLEEVGLSIHHELGIDEYGRNRVKYKLNEREFQEQHQQEVIDALKGNGLVKVLSFALTDETYKVNGFGMCYEPCEHCKQNYIEGTIYRPDMDEQYFQGVNGYDLHALANHPETYVNEFDSFRKIHRLLSDVKDHIPVFISNPEILPELFAFVKIFDKYIAADAKSFDFWMNTSGGISSYEEEEIEDPCYFSGGEEMDLSDEEIKQKEEECNK